MFGRSPHMSELPALAAFDTGTYQRQLRTKLAKLKDFTDGHRRKVVHINRLLHRIQPSTPEAKLTPVGMSPWQPPSVNHDEIPVGETTAQPRYPWRIRSPQIVCSSGRAESQGGRM